MTTQNIIKAERLGGYDMEYFDKLARSAKHSVTHMMMDRYSAYEEHMTAIRIITTCLKFDSVGFDETKQDLINMRERHLESILILADKREHSAEEMREYVKYIRKYAPENEVNENDN